MLRREMRRLPSGNHPEFVPPADVQRALQFMRQARSKLHHCP